MKVVERRFLLVRRQLLPLRIVEKEGMLDRVESRKTKQTMED